MICMIHDGSKMLQIYTVLHKDLINPFTSFYCIWQPREKKYIILIMSWNVMMSSMVKPTCSQMGRQPQAYLRFEKDQAVGVVTSRECNVALDASGRPLDFPWICREPVFVWEMWSFCNQTIYRYGKTMKNSLFTICNCLYRCSSEMKLVKSIDYFPARHGWLSKLSIFDCQIVSKLSTFDSKIFHHQIVMFFHRQVMLSAVAWNRWASGTYGRDCRRPGSSGRWTPRRS